jgi:hypothetical protein
MQRKLAELVLQLRRALSPQVRPQVAALLWTQGMLATHPGGVRRTAGGGHLALWCPGIVGPGGRADGAIPGCGGPGGPPTPVGVNRLPKRGSYPLFFSLQALAEGGRPRSCPREYSEMRPSLVAVLFRGYIWGGRDTPWPVSALVTATVVCRPVSRRTRRFGGGMAAKRTCFRGNGTPHLGPASLGAGGMTCMEDRPADEPTNCRRRRRWAVVIQRVGWPFVWGWSCSGEDVCGKCRIR